MGNCGVGIAPCRPEAREIATRDLVNVEGIQFEVLDAASPGIGRPFRNSSTPRRTRLGAQSRLHRAADPVSATGFMGEASMERGATPEETAQIKALIGEAVDAGAFGFSTTILNQHMGYASPPRLPQRQPR